MDKNKVRALKAVNLKTEQLLQALYAADDLLDKEDKEELTTLANRPIGLRDTGSFNLPLNLDTREDLAEARRELSSAITAHKWAEGFGMAVKIITILGGV